MEGEHNCEYCEHAGTCPTLKRRKENKAVAELLDKWRGKDEKFGKYLFPFGIVIGLIGATIGLFDFGALSMTIIICAFPCIFVGGILFFGP